MTTGAQAGALLALRIETATADTYVDLAGMRSKSFSINNESIDTTNSDSTGRWVEILSAIATRSVEFSGDGVFKDGAAFDRLRVQTMANPPIAKCQVFVPTLGTFTGSYFIGNLEITGDHDGEIAYSASFSSTGEVTFVNIT